MSARRARQGGAGGRARKRSGTRPPDPSGARCGRCQALLADDWRSVTLDDLGRLDSCPACWPSLIEMIRQEGYDLRPFAHVPHLVLVPDPPTPLAPWVSMN